MAGIGKLVDRRLFLASGLGLACPAISRASKSEHVYRFATRYCDIQVSVKFHDRYSSQGFWFNNRSGDSPFCLSLTSRSRDCLGRFTGSLAIAQYEIRSRSKEHRVPALREYVQNIDRDARLDFRPPLDRRVELLDGKASDLQVFGYQESGISPAPAATPRSFEPWYYFRQDVYLEPETIPFLIIHWKHTLGSIRMLDIIPGQETSIVSK